VNAIKSTLLTLAVREARQFGATAHEVLESFAKGTVRPELQVELDTQLAALGVPAPSAISMAETVFTDDLRIDDLLTLVQGYARSGQELTPPQAREINEVATRLFKATRRRAKHVDQAQTIANSLMEQDAVLAALEHPAPPPQTFHRARSTAVHMPGRGISR
jgi:hypothetical protein